jgi:hypothetical protein
MVEGLKTIGRVEVATGIAKERRHSSSCVPNTGSVVKERFITKGRVTLAVGKIKEGATPLASRLIGG